MNRPTPAEIEKLAILYDEDEDQMVAHLVQDDGLTERQARALVRAILTPQTDGELAAVVELDGKRKEPFLPPLEQLLAELAETAAAEDRRERVHQVIRRLASAPVQTQQKYRDGIVEAKYIRAGDWREALKEAKQGNAADQFRNTGAQDEQEPDPQDALDITDEPDAVHQITNAISNGVLPEVYVRGRQLVHVDVSEDYVGTRDLDEPLMRLLIADYLPCKKLTKIGYVGALPVPMTCKVILAREDWDKVPKLTGVASYPILLSDGSILQKPGYDQASGLYLHQGKNIGPISENPSKDEIQKALGFLQGKFLRDFPWASDADQANYLGALLTLPMREVIGDLFPLVYITAPERGSGKSLLAELPTILYGGAIRTFPESDGEMQKVITATLRGAEPVIVFDNVEQVVKSSSLAAVLTTKMWTGRILGGNVDGKWPNDRLWMLTGTNIALGGDLAQRSMRIAIDYGRPDPDQRIGFAIPNIGKWTQANRGKVIAALLTLARAWQIGGAPEVDHVMRGFTRWARIVGGVLAYHGIPGFLANREETQVHDEDYSEWLGFLRTLLSVYGDRPQLARGILTDVPADQVLGDAMPSTPDGGAWTVKTFGKALRAHAGRWYGGLSIRSVEDKHAGAQRWIVSKLDTT